MWFYPLSSFSSQPFLCCCNLVYATWILIYLRNLDLNYPCDLDLDLSTLLGFGFIHAILTWIFPRDLDLDFSTRLGLGFVHATSTWIHLHDLDLSTQLGLVIIHATQTQIYRRDLDLSMQLRLGFIHATWTQIFFSRKLDLDLVASVLIHSYSIQIISAWSIPLIPMLLLIV